MMAMLEVHDLNAWYGASHILHGVSISVQQGEVVALVGRNGAGKTTTIRSIMGLMPRTSGSIARSAGHSGAASRPPTERGKRL